MTFSFQRKTHRVYIHAVTIIVKDTPSKHRFLNHTEALQGFMGGTVPFMSYVWRILFIKYKPLTPHPYDDV